MCQWTYPFGEAYDYAREPNRCRSEQGRRRSDETPFETLNLQQVLPNRANLDVVFVRLADAAKEVDGVGVAEIPVDRLQDVTLGLKNLRLTVRGVGTVEKVTRRRRNDFFELRSDEHARDPDELKLGEGNDARRKEAVDDVDAKEQRLRE